MIFDKSHYVRLIEARGETIRSVVAQLKPALGLFTALDAGCGVGFFSEILQQCGLDVRGFDGRQSNVEEATKRFPGIPFALGDIESERIRELGGFDLVLCFGLLYHLENPLLAIRNLSSLTGKCLLLESMCLPGQEPCMVLREEPSAEDQSLTDLAFYASEGCIVKMLYRAGFKSVLRLGDLPTHDDFAETAEHLRRRTVLLACRESLSFPGFIAVAEPPQWRDPWQKEVPPRTFLERMKDFNRYSRQKKLTAIGVRWRKWFPRIPYPLRLPFGRWWLASDGRIDELLLWQGGFVQEEAQMSFVSQFLRPGMTVLDVGAHHGLYTLLASKLVGKNGAVIAFEPSARERKRLRQHVRLNFCRNVRIEPFAAGSGPAQAKLYVAERASEDVCNSLRPPAIDGTARPVDVEILALDDYLDGRGLGSVDFMKLDVEGGELEALKGAERLLCGKGRPVILAEVQDFRTLPWGYPAREIIDWLAQKRYVWFAVLGDGTLRILDTSATTFDGTHVACPEERLQEIQLLTNPPTRTGEA